MNLWAKRSVRQLAVLAVALFFFSCEDETSILGFKNPKPKFKVSFIEIPLESSVVLTDSIITDNKGFSGVMVGQYNDAVVGPIRAEAFLQMLPVSVSKIDASAAYDSVTFQSRLNFYSYGFTGSQTFKIRIHEIISDSLDRRPTTRYYYNSPAFQYNSIPLGDTEITVHYDSLRKQSALNPANQDTLLLTAQLDDDFGFRLFDFAKNDPDGTFSTASKFIYAIKGLALQHIEGTGVIGLNSLAGLSNVTLHYHTVGTDGTETKFQKIFTFAGSNYNPNFTRITNDRSTSELAPITAPYQSYQPPSGLRVIQNGSQVIAKLDFAKFYDFADTIENAVINSAEFVISDVESPEGVTAHSNLGFKVMNNNDQFANYQFLTEREAVQTYFVSRDAGASIYFGNPNHYFVISDNPSSSPEPAVIGYDATKKQYSGFMTLFIQNLFTNKGTGTINENRIKFVGLFPASPGPGSSVNRTVFNANNVKLRIYYTRPTANTNTN